MQQDGARTLRGTLGLIVGTFVVSGLFAAAMAYFLEVVPSADGPHPIDLTRMTTIWAMFTPMVALIFAVAIPATRYWDPRATSWEAFVCLTTVLVIGPAALAILIHLGAARDSKLAQGGAFVVAALGYLLVRWLYRRRWPPAPRDDRFRFGFRRR